MTPLAARALGVGVRRTKNAPYRRATRLGRDLQFRVDASVSDTGSRTGWEYGLLGANFLEHYVVELDFQERRVRFLDPKRYRVPERVTAPDEAVIPMRVTAKRPFTTIEVDGKMAQVAIDTGAPLPIYLSGKEARKVGLDPDSLPYYGEMGTTMGDTPGHIGEVDSLRFAGFELGRAPVVVMPRGWFNMGGSSDSVIGYDVLQQFKLRLDYPRGRLWLKRRGDTRVTFHGADYESIRETGVFLDQPDPASAAPAAPPGATTAEAEETTPSEAAEASAPAAAKAPAPPPVPTAEEQAAAWQERMDDRLFVFDNGGWRVVDGWRRRMGPKEGEIWVTYEQTSEMKRTGQVSEGAGD
jgi:predicted aspartyl protease